jgi:SEC-C motif domain protein
MSNHYKSMPAQCPCGSGKLFNICCQPYINMERPAPTAETLMRSRFSAFAIGNVEYLLFTRHSSTKMFDSRDDLQKSLESTEWCSLQVLSANQTDQTGEVEFVAFYREANNGYGQIHERSQFKQEGDQWFYVDGVHLPPVKLQRNDLCWCGSGKKLKQCCG